MCTYVSVLMLQLRASTQLGNLLQLKTLFFSSCFRYINLVISMLVAVSGHSVSVLVLFFSCDYLGPGTLAQASRL